MDQQSLCNTVATIKHHPVFNKKEAETGELREPVDDILKYVGIGDGVSNYGQRTHSLLVTAVHWYTDRVSRGCYHCMMNIYLLPGPTMKKGLIVSQSIFPTWNSPNFASTIHVGLLPLVFYPTVKKRLPWAWVSVLPFCVVFQWSSQADPVECVFWLGTEDKRSIDSTTGKFQKSW